MTLKHFRKNRSLKKRVELIQDADFLMWFTGVRRGREQRHHQSQGICAVGTELLFALVVLFEGAKCQDENVA